MDEPFSAPMGLPAIAAEGHTAGGHATGAHAAEGHKTEGHTAEGHKTEGHTAEAHTVRERGQRRRSRLLRVGAVAVVVAGGIAVLLATSSRNAAISAGRSAGTTAAIASLLKGIPQHDNVLGYPGAPITLAYFGDLECPFCRELTLGALPSIIARWVRAGTLRIAYRSMETATREPRVFTRQQVAALAAGRQNKMWYFLELFYHEQGEEDSGYVTEQYLQGLAKQVPGLNLAQWMSDRNDPALAAKVEADKRLAQKLRFPGTPSLFFGKTGGAAIKYNAQSLKDPAGFNRVIEAVMASSNR